MSFQMCDLMNKIVKSIFVNLTYQMTFKKDPQGLILSKVLPQWLIMKTFTFSY